MDIPKQYDPKTVEPKWQSYWEENKTYAFDPDSDKPIYAIDTPPPTVSGAMHLGHAFSYNQMDFIARYKRMQGHNMFYPFGTDDNGLATERLIEKMKGVRSKNMDRNDFVKLCLDTLKEIRPGFIADWKRVGISSDYTIFYSTIDDHCRKISQRSFIELYVSDRVYRNDAPIIFCPQCQTAIAQVEMEDVKRKSTLNYIKAKVEDGSYVIFATTRPELIHGCIGMSIDTDGEYVKVKVEDETWVIAKDTLETFQEEFSMVVIEELHGSDLVGKEVTIPISGNKVKITHDQLTETKYGTGIVYYCTYGGMDCIEWLTRHPGTEPINIMGLDGRYNELTGKYKGLRSDEARKTVISDLEASKDLIKKDNIEHAVNTHERCGTDIEYVATAQWFIKVLDLKQDLLDRAKEMNWFPDHMRSRYDNWAHGLKWDWCISRQRHFGVPFPLWYCKKCEKPKLANVEDLPIDPTIDDPKSPCDCGSTDFEAEKDVLDTWATSSLTPQLAVELYKDHPVFEKLYPMSLRPQAHDIITFWLFNTVIKSHLHYDKYPWHNIMISGWALASNGKKMSKSKGNVIAPQEMIDKYSADALRFWAGGSSLGMDLPFKEKDLVTGQKFVNKMWNASKFAMSHLEGYEHDPDNPPELEIVDKWILARLNHVVQIATEAFERYEFSKCKLETEKFYWHDFCDNYLEFIKDRIYNPEKHGGEDAKKAAQYTLYVVTLNCLKLMAPIMPYVTEEIYNFFFKEKDGSDSIHISQWPQVDKQFIDQIDALEAGALMKQIVAVVRQYKQERKLSLATEIKSLSVHSTDDKYSNYLTGISKDLQGTSRAKELILEESADGDELTLENSELPVKIRIKV